MDATTATLRTRGSPRCFSVTMIWCAATITARSIHRNGSRLLVGNAELRFPLFGALGIGTGYYGVFPLELAAFGDAGVAWNQGESPTVFGGTRRGVASAGLAARINVFGFAVAQIDWVHPFDRPQRNWLWQFSLQPGF